MYFFLGHNNKFLPQFLINIIFEYNLFIILFYIIIFFIIFYNIIINLYKFITHIQK